MKIRDFFDAVSVFGPVKIVCTSLDYSVEIRDVNKVSSLDPFIYSILDFVISRVYCELDLLVFECDD